MKKFAEPLVNLVSDPIKMHAKKRYTLADQEKKVIVIIHDNVLSSQLVPLK